MARERLPRGCSSRPFVSERWKRLLFANNRHVMALPDARAMSVALPKYENCFKCAKIVYSNQFERASFSFFFWVLNSPPTPDV